MFKKILVAYDGSDAAKHAFDLGLDLAQKYGAALRVLAVVKPPEFGDEVETGVVIENSRGHYQCELRPLRDHTTKLGFSVDMLSRSVTQPNAS